MKVIVSSSEKSMDAQVDPRFGRCPFFVLVDSETMEHQFHDNLGLQATGGAGIQAAQQVVTLGAQVIISGNMGPNAFSVLRAGDLKIFTAVGGSIREVVEQLKQGKLQEAGNANAAPHWK